jgi:hypothetical protein
MSSVVLFTICYYRVEMDKTCSKNGGRMNAYKILVGKLEGNRPTLETQVQIRG